MSILAVGSVAYDSVKTPSGGNDDALGGALTYFSVAASYFASVGMVAVVGDDFRPEDRAMLDAHFIDTTSLVAARGETLRWMAEYREDMNEAHTLDIQLNVFDGFMPKLTSRDMQHPFLFLANIDPDLQHHVLKQMGDRPTLVAGDTMNLWINTKSDSLEKVIGSVDLLMINETEARLLTGEASLVKAARNLLSRGPHTVVVKRGEYGALCFTPDAIFAAPAYPLETAVDPTGAGDSFAGGFLGYVAATGDLTIDGYRRAMIVGSVMASFTVENFGLDRLSALTHADIRDRYKEFWKLTYFDGSGERELPSYMPTEAEGRNAIR
jgi:sugar/nucleoside kinase (ribokinase family)